MYVFCFSCPGATFALQRSGFVQREWLAVKGILLSKALPSTLRSLCCPGEWIDYNDARKVLDLLGSLPFLDKGEK